MIAPSLRATLACFLLTAFLSSGLFAVEEIEGTANPEAIGERISEKEIIAAVEVPEGFVTEVFARDPMVQDPTAIAFDEKGRLYISETHRFDRGIPDNRRNLHWVRDDIALQTTEERLAMYEKHAAIKPLSHFTEYSEKVRVIEDRDGDGKADFSEVFADGFDDPLDGTAAGVMAANGTVYLACIPKVWALRDTDGDLKADEREVVQDGFGVSVSLSGHDLNGFTFGPDGRIYFTIGDRGFNFTSSEGKEFFAPNSGAIFRMEADGSDLEIVHSGLRNPKEIDFDQYGRAFSVDNNADMGDKARIVYVVEGADSGWHRGNQNLNNFRDFIDISPRHQPLWMKENQWDFSGEHRTAAYLPPSAHLTNGPSGLIYNPGTSLPDRYDDHFFVCDYRGANSSLIAFAMQPAGGGFELARNETFARGILNTDVDFGYDGKLYVSDLVGSWSTHGFGNVLTLSHPATLEKAAPVIEETAALFKEGFETMEAARLADLLGHPDRRVRLRAQFALAKSTGNGEHFIRATATENELTHRLHGVWGLGQIARSLGSDEAVTTLIELADDSDAVLRGQIAQALGDARSAEGFDALSTLLGDADLNTRMLASIAIGKLGNEAAVPLLISVLTNNETEDPHVRQGAVSGLALLHREGLLTDYENDPSAAVRLGVLLGYRSVGDSSVAHFLHDASLPIAVEAVQAINDELIEKAIPSLAAASHLVGKSSRYIDYRIINGAFREGSPESAAKVLATALDETLPAETRTEALFVLGRWEAPPVVDPTTGLYRPLEGERDLSSIDETLSKGLQKLVAESEGPLLTEAMRTAQAFAIQIPNAALLTQTRRQENDAEVRLAALESLRKQEFPELKPLLLDLVDDETIAVRLIAMSMLGEVAPEEALTVMEAKADNGKIVDRQKAYQVLGDLALPGAAARIAKDMKALADLPPALHLDLVEAAAKRTEPAVIETLSAYNALIPAEDPLAAFATTLAGGDPVRGKEVFYYNGAAQCSRCHKADKKMPGGIAGPDLWKIGSRHDAAYLLESLVLPSAKLAEGYSTVSLTLKDGTSLAGTLMKETDEQVTVKDIASGDTVAVSREDIASMPPGMSTMPPMGLVLPKRDVRDLVAYLDEVGIPPKKPKKKKK